MGVYSLSICIWQLRRRRLFASVPSKLEVIPFSSHNDIKNGRILGKKI